MTTTQYKIRNGFSLKGDPNAIGARLEELKGDSGELRPGDVVVDAENESSPLHNCFEWDDTEAARQHRLEQARYVIRSIEVTYEEVPGKEEVVVGVQYANLGDRGSSEPYRDVRTIMKDKTMRERYVRMVLRALKSLREKYKHVKELADVYAAIDRAAATFR